LDAEQRPYPTDISDEEWTIASPCLSPTSEHAPQHKYALRSMFNALLDGACRSALAADAQRLPATGSGLPADPALAVAGCFEAMVDALRCRRHRSLIATPASASRRTPMICSSEKRLFLISLG
jgi:transposase